MNEFEKFFDDLVEKRIISKFLHFLFQPFEGLLNFTEELRVKFLNETEKFIQSPQGLKELNKISWQKKRLISRSDDPETLFFGCIFLEWEIEKENLFLSQFEIRLIRKILILILDEILGAQKRAI